MGTLQGVACLFMNVRLFLCILWTMKHLPKLTKTIIVHRANGLSTIYIFYTNVLFDAPIDILETHVPCNFPFLSLSMSFLVLYLGMNNKAISTHYLSMNKLGKRTISYIDTLWEIIWNFSVNAGDKNRFLQFINWSKVTLQVQKRQ